jgi:hypothetical protein
MLNVQPGKPVQFQMGETTYSLRFTLRALKTLEHEHDIAVMRGGEPMIAAVRDAGKLALILYYGLKGAQPDITLDWVEDNFDSTMLLELAPVIAQAISGKAVDSPNEPPPGKVNGIGSLSGPSDDTTSASVTATSGISTLRN